MPLVQSAGVLLLVAFIHLKKILLLENLIWLVRRSGRRRIIFGGENSLPFGRWSGDQQRRSHQQRQKHSVSIEQLEIYRATILDFLNED